jgi:hypothetical protein
MDGMDSDEELFLTQNSFSEEILQPNFSIHSLLDAIEGRVMIKMGILMPNP